MMTLAIIIVVAFLIGMFFISACILGARADRKIEMMMKEQKKWRKDEE